MGDQNEEQPITRGFSLSVEISKLNEDQLRGFAEEYLMRSRFKEKRDSILDGKSLVYKGNGNLMFPELEPCEWCNKYTNNVGHDSLCPYRDIRRMDCPNMID